MKRAWTRIDHKGRQTTLYADVDEEGIIKVRQEILAELLHAIGYTEVRPE